MNKTITSIILGIILLLGFVIYFSAQNNKTYECPKEGEYITSGEYKYIDCMPPTRNEFFRLDYRKWIIENCLDISFVD